MSLFLEIGFTFQGFVFVICFYICGVPVSFMTIKGIFESYYFEAHWLWFCNTG
jgi:hypothetical protein